MSHWVSFGARSVRHNLIHNCTAHLFVILHRNSQLLAKFKLCPADSKYCRHAGEYVIPMDQFVDAYETVISTDNGCAAQEETCIASCQDMYDGYQSSSYQAEDYQEEEAAEDNNNNNNNNNAQSYSGGSQYSNYAQNNYAYGYQNGGGRRKLEENSANQFDFDGCMSDCMNSAGMSSCENQGNGASSVAQGVGDLVQCKQIGDNAYVGAVCKHGGVYMGTFKDSACSKSAPSGTFEALVSFIKEQKGIQIVFILFCFILFSHNPIH